MEYIVILSLNLLLIIAIWVFLYKPAIKSRKKAELLVLKKTVNSFFQSNKHLGAKHQMKARLDQMLDSTIVALDSVSFSSYIAWQKQIESNEELKDEMHKRIELKYFTKDKALSDFVEKIRGQSSTIGTCYLIESSFFLISFAIILSIYFGIKEMLKRGKLHLKSLKPDVENQVEKIIKPEFIVEKSYLNQVCNA